MADDEPELDAKGRPRHDDPRDNAVPIETGKRSWLPWVIGAVVVVALLVVFVGP